MVIIGAMMTYSTTSWHELGKVIQEEVLMAIEGLTVIGESINDSVPSTNQLYEAGDLEGIKALAKMQDEAGAAYIDVNVGTRGAELMQRVVREVQSVTAKPLSIDTPSVELARAGLEAYDADRAGGALPILNSISLLRPEMFDLYAIQPFTPILLITERVEGGSSKPNVRGEQTYETAKQLLSVARERCGLEPHQVIFDPGAPPIVSDTEGLVRAAVEALALMHEDPELAGYHASVGLSNLTVMLPTRRSDGMPVKSTLESALLTKCMPLGLDMAITSVKRKHEILPADHPAMQCLEDVLKLEGYDTIMRVMEFYSQ